MSKDLHFGAKIVVGETGKKKIEFHSLRWLQHNLNQLKDGQEISVVIDVKKPKRTVQQCRFYWGAYLPLICEATGHTPEELHAYFKGKYLTRGIKSILGHPTRLQASTTDLNVSEFSEYIRNIESESGIPAPDPTNYSLSI